MDHGDRDTESVGPARVVGEAAIESAWQQAPGILCAFEGDDFILAAWNDAGRSVMAPMWGSLGQPLREVEHLPGSGVEEMMRRATETGEPQSSSDFRTAQRDASGVLREYCFDFTVSPWRWPDGSIRGVTLAGRDVSHLVRARDRAEERMARALESPRTAREVTAALQAALIPAAVPVLPTTQVGARYLTAPIENSAGGDWFSAVVNPQGHLALVVGDVVGHGVTAAATMAQLRAVLEERLRAGEGPAAALAALDRFATGLPGAEAAKMCLALLDPTTGVLDYCAAGHVPPLVIEQDRAFHLAPTDSGPLGSGNGFGTRTVTLGPGAAVMLYTDGLVMRPGRTPDECAEDVATAALNAFHGRPLLLGAPTHTADRVCEISLEVLTRQAASTDDITVLVAHRIAALAPLSLTVPSDPGAALAAVRHELTRWLAAVGASRRDQLDLSHVAVELVTNALEHGAGSHEPPTVTVEVDLDPQGCLTISVTDDGTWTEPARPSGDAADVGGLGLVLARRLTEELWVRRDADGTTVTACRHLTRPAPMERRRSGNDAATRRLASEEFAVALLPNEPDTLTVIGPLVIDTAEELSALIDVESRGGTRPITVDLGEVSLLASAGVRVLQRAQRAAEEAGITLDIFAPADSVAHRILTLVALPHRT